MITLVVLATLVTIGLPSYQRHIENTRIKVAIKDIAELSMTIERYYTDNDTYPPDLAAVTGNPVPLDPWGNAYQYLGIDVAPPPGPGALRRDKNMNPLNSDFDLFSMGPDGQTQKQLTASKARDDIVRAGNGGYVGVAEEH